jgi:hypothetical protein
MFRGGSTSNEGIMSVPRKGYERAGSVDSEFDFGFLGDSRETSGLRNLSSDYYGGFSGNNKDLLGLGLSTERNDTTESNQTLNKKELKEKIIEGDIADELGLSPLGKRLRQRYLSQRGDPLGKFLINFGLNYMSARPRGGKFGALTTAAEAAKKPTEQLYADQDTEAALELKLLSAFGKEKDTDAMKIAKAYAQKYGGTAEDYLAMVAKRKIESSDLKDYSDVALIRKYGEDWGKENKVNSAIQRLNVGKFRLRLEKGEIDKEILGNLPSKGSEIMITEDYTPKKDNSKVLEINPQAAQDYQTGKVYVNPIDKQFYIVQGEGNKKTFVGIDKYY